MAREHRVARATRRGPFQGSLFFLQKQAPVSEPGKIEFFTKTDFFIIQVETGEVWGCPGGAPGPYEDIPSNFGRIWSYMASESPLFII